MKAANIILAIAAGISFLISLSEAEPPHGNARCWRATIAFLAIDALIVVLNLFK